MPGGQSIVLVNNETLYSGTNGERRYYWAPPATYRLPAGAASVQTYTDITAVSSDGGFAGRLNVHGQYSLDGQNWVDFGRVLTEVTIGLSAAGRRTYNYAGGAGGFEFGPYVRLGCSVEATGGTQQQWVRCTVAFVLHGVLPDGLTPPRNLVRPPSNLLDR